MASPRSAASARPIASGASAALLAVPALAAPLGVLWWMARPIYPFIEDDALISLRYARRLLDGQGLTWTAGETVEGYSNLLWVLLSAAVGALGVDLITAARALGIASVVGCLWALLQQARAVQKVVGDGRVWIAPVAACGAGLVLCASGPIALWSIAGLEQPLVAALLMWSVLAAAPLLLRAGDDTVRRHPARSRDALALGVPLSLLVWTRPDSPLFVAVFALVLALAGPGDRQARLRLATRVTALPLGAWLAQLGFRVLYHGDILPNPAYLKASFSSDRVAGGIAYLQAGARFLWPLLLLSGLAAVDGLRDPRRRAWTGLLLTCALLWSLYVAAIGGDHFPGHRHLVPVVVLASALIASAVAALPMGAASRWAAPVALLLLTGSAFGHAKLQQRDPDYTMGQRARWQWDGKALGELFGSAFAEQKPLWAVTAAGCMPYFSNLPALDMLGLNDRHIARQPRDPGMPLAHDHGDGAYVLDRQPDLITFGLPTGGRPVYLSGKQMQGDPRFARDYRAVTFRVFEPHVVTSTTYVRLEGRVGIARDGAVVNYPAYLLTGVVGQPLPDGRLGGLLPADAPSTTVELSLRPGRHRVSLSPDNPRMSLDVVVASGDVRVTAGPHPEVHVDSGARLRLAVRSHGAEAQLHSIRVERLDGATPPAASVPARLSERTLLRAATVGHAKTAVAEPLVELDFESGLGEFQRTGNAMAVSDGAIPGQMAVVGARGKLLNTFVPGLGDRATGSLLSAPFTPRPSSILQLRIGGGRARDYQSQVGVAILADGRVIQMLTGDNSERLRMRRLDLSAYAGSEIRVQLIDNARGPWGHLLVDELRVLP